MFQNNPCGHMKGVVFHRDEVCAPANGVERIVNQQWEKQQRRGTLIVGLPSEGNTS